MHEKYWVTAAIALIIFRHSTSADLLHCNGIFLCPRILQKKEFNYVNMYYKYLLFRKDHSNRFNQTRTCPHAHSQFCEWNSIKIYWNWFKRKKCRWADAKRTKKGEKWMTLRKQNDELDGNASKLAKKGEQMRQRRE